MAHRLQGGDQPDRRLEAGKITPVIDRTYQLGDVAEAIRYLETGHARGKVAITV